MLQHPAFTRLGWGSGDEASSENEDGTRGRDRRTQTLDNEAQEDWAEPETADVSETAIQNGDPASPDRSLPPVEQSQRHSSTDSDGTEETGPENTGVDDDPGRADRSADPTAAMALDSDVKGDSLKIRLDRWDAAQLNLSRPASPDTADSPTDAKDVDQRSVDKANAVAYVAANKEQRPWLAPVSDCEPEVQSVYASLDQGAGHAHIRHGPMGDDKMYADRVARLEDPAQSDPELRAQSADGFRASDLHYCAEFATRVHDARAFAAVVVVLSEEPKVRQALETGWNDVQPHPIVIPIADVLGPNGHEYCSGFRLKGDWPQSKLERKQWARARAAGQDLGDLPEPRAERIPTFEDGHFVVQFKRNDSARRYEINTIFAEPAQQ